MSYAALIANFRQRPGRRIPFVLNDQLGGLVKLATKNSRQETKHLDPFYWKGQPRQGFRGSQAVGDIDPEPKGGDQLKGASPYSKAKSPSLRTAISPDVCWHQTATFLWSGNLMTRASPGEREMSLEKGTLATSIVGELPQIKRHRGGKTEGRQKGTAWRPLLRIHICYTPFPGRPS